MADLRAEVANLPIVGEHFSDQLTGGGRRYRNHIAWRLSRYTVDLYQHPVVFGRYRDIEKRFAPTTTILVRGVPSSRQRFAERLVIDLCHLLSLATLSEVRPFAFTYGAHTLRWSTSGITMRFRPPIESDGEAVRQFVDATWTAYRKLRRTRKLPEIIHYLTLAEHPMQPVEARLLFAFVVLENLKATWAHQRGIPFVAGFFRKPGKHGHVGRKSPTYSFKELLTAMFRAVRMRPALGRIIKVRNDIVHFGLSLRPIEANADYYDRTRSLVHEYILRLLDYRGSYLDYRTREWRTL